MPLTNPEIISSTIFDVEGYHDLTDMTRNMTLISFGHKNIIFDNIVTQKYRHYLPVYACAEVPLGFHSDGGPGKGYLSSLWDGIVSFVRVSFHHVFRIYGHDFCKRSFKSSMFSWFSLSPDLWV